MVSAQQQPQQQEEQSCNNSKPTVEELLSYPSNAIVEALGGIYEHSPWVAEIFVRETTTTTTTTATNAPIITTVTQLAQALRSIVDDASREQQLALLVAHPDLCEKVEKMKELTADSQEEQSKAGLQSMVGDELETFKAMNNAYKTKFGFPFILAVRNASKHTVLSALEGRLPHSAAQEFQTAMEQVHKIAWMRLLSKVNTDHAAGFLTCHGECKSKCTLIIRLCGHLFFGGGTNP
jgi:2-oxo-4-hydroxy-4-carboxy-5-ureidoimidazoline decarboxylase